MMKPRKIAAILLTLVLLFTLGAPSIAAPESEITEGDVKTAISTVNNSLKELSDTSANAESLGSAFNTFMDVVTDSGRILTLVNGSVTFLRLIGVIEDPTQSKLDNIMKELQTIDERLSSMDDKLDDLTTAMSEIKASVEFNSRTEKAILYEGSWRDFEYRYMEDGMDKLITKYNSMLRTGLLSWCGGTRSDNGVDNSKIIILYKKTDDGYKLIYSDYNGVPSDIGADDRYIIIPASCLPETFSYNVNTFNADLETAIYNSIKAATDGGNADIFTVKNYEKLTPAGCAQLTDDDIKVIANDAVNTLVYRVASAKVNGDTTFAGEVSRQFSNYCTHLKTSGDGIDAALKTFYLTHAFEYSVADDIKDYCNRMIILTGTYGTFAAGVLGMSHLTTDSEKEAAVVGMTTAIKTVSEAKNNGITGNGNYCYITGTTLIYGMVLFTASAEITAHYTVSNTTYKSYKASGPSYVYGGAIGKNATPVGDSAMLILTSTLASNGIKTTHDYLNKNIGSGKVTDYGKIVTGHSGVQTLSFDGKTKLHVKNAFGSYFSNNSNITTLPSKADSEDVLYRKKISGSLYDTASGNITANTTLCAIAAYGENHFYWTTDEGAFMGGPSDSNHFEDDYYDQKTGSDSTGVIRTHKYSLSNSYNVLLSAPLTNLYVSGQYNPLMQFNSDIKVCTYNETVYDINNGDASKDIIDKAAESSSETEDTSSKATFSTIPESDSEVASAVTAETVKGGFPTVPVIIAVALIIIAATATCIIVKKKKQ